MWVKMEGSSSPSSSSVAVAAALALSAAGCSLILLSYLTCTRDKPHTPNSFSNPTVTPCIRRTTSSTPPVKGVRKHVRFAGVKEISNQNNKVRKAKQAAGKSAPDAERKQRRLTALPENWRRLYCGINRYRSHQATMLIYA